MSSFGSVFRVTTFGESHCKGVGAIIDGVPPNFELTEADIQPQLTRRRPGQSDLTTPRDEKDKVTILSGTEKGRTLGTPIGLFVPNEDQRPGDYKEMSTVPRPGHADWTYQIKYGIRASSGGGRSSARETIGRVAAGAVAEKWLRQTYGTEIVAWVSAIGSVEMPHEELLRSDGMPYTRADVDKLGCLSILVDPKYRATSQDSTKRQKTSSWQGEDTSEADFLAAVKAGSHLPSYRDVQGVVYSWDGSVVATPSDIDQWDCSNVVPVRCPHPSSAAKMATLIRQVKSEKDSIGGVITCVCTGVPAGLGEPCFDKLEAKLAHAMMSLPATKGFEIGSGFGGTKLRGSEHNDMFVKRTSGDPTQSKITTKTNFAGGTLGGISNGAPIVMKVAIKSVSTIGRAQETSTFDGDPAVLEAKGRHDPCVLPRAPPLLEGMAALVLADAALIQRTRLGGALTIADASATMSTL